MHTTHRSLWGTVSSLARTHDDLPAFNAAYWALTLIAAMLFNAGAFAVLVIGHMALDVYKYRDIHGKQWRKVVDGVFRENLIDTALLFLSIAFSVYCHSSLPIFAGMQGLFRTELTVVNGLIQVTTKAHILHNVLTILANVHQYLHSLHPNVGKHVSLVEAISIVALVVSLSLTIASPWILGLDQETIAHMAKDILIPWSL